jgi:hypothetical protein
MTPSRVASTASFVAVLLTASMAGAQQSVGLAPAVSSRVTLTAARTDTIEAGGDASLTIVFRVKNAGPDSVVLHPSLTLPDGWSALTPSPPLSLAPHSDDLWLASVGSSARARAGVYVLRGGITGPGFSETDSAVVRIAERRGLEVRSTEVPNWVMSDKSYSARFLVHNSGNVESIVKLSATASSGAGVVANPAVVKLAAGASSVVTLSVQGAAATDRATDNIVELTATDATDSQTHTAATALTTVIPPAPGMLDGMTSVPAQLSLRAAGKGVAVSPLVLVGSGRLGETNTTVDFSFHSKPGDALESPFGEHEEYRVRAQSGHLSVKLGDDWFGFTPLTSIPGSGRGAQFETTFSEVRTGAFVQRAGLLGVGPLEEGVLLATPLGQRQLGLAIVQRSSDIGTARMESVSGATPLALGAALSMELASTDSVGVRGAATRTAVTGKAKTTDYDFTYQRGNDRFAGVLRGISTEDALVTTQVTPDFSVRGYLGVTSSARPDTVTGLLSQRLSTGALGVSYKSASTLELTTTDRSDGQVARQTANQRGARLTSGRSFGSLYLDGNIEKGFAHLSTINGYRGYTTLGGVGTLQLGGTGSLSLFLDHQDGQGINGDGNPVLQGGATAQLSLPQDFRVGVLATGSSANNASTPTTNAQFQYGRLDARVEHELANGGTLALRLNLWQNPNITQPGARQSAVYLEYRTGVHIPVGRKAQRGLAEGTVRDAASGAPIKGALVRIGDAAAVTDEAGHAEFTGLEPGEHFVSLAPTGAAVGALLAGDGLVRVVEKSEKPASFTITITRGARLRARLALMDYRGTLGESADSLVQTGVLSDVVVLLTSGRDTVYQTSNDEGVIDFGQVQPGHWVVSVPSGALPDDHVLEANPLDVSLAAGEQRQITLRAIPQKRAITFVGGETELRPKMVPQHR